MAHRPLHRRAPASTDRRGQARGAGSAAVLCVVAATALACGSGAATGRSGTGDDDRTPWAPAGAGSMLDSAGAGGPGDAAGSDPTPESTLVIAARSLPDRIDPLDATESWGARMTDGAVFQGLVTRDTGGHPWARPALADACVQEAGEAPRAVWCHLAAGHEFHDGTPVTADDVLYSLGHWLDPRRGWLRDRHGLSGLKKVELVDGPPASLLEAAPLPGFEPAARDPGQWIRIGFVDPEPLALELLSMMTVVPERAHRGKRRAFGEAPIGSGPLKITTLEADRIVLEPVAPPSIGPSDGPARTQPVTRIVLRQVDDGAQVLTALRRGEVHVATELSPVHVPVELAKPGMDARFTAWLLSPPRYDLVLYNLRSGPQSGPRLRAALDGGIPRAAIANAVGGLPPLPIDAPVDLHEPTQVDLATLAAAGPGGDPSEAGLPRTLDAVAVDEQGAADLASELDALGWELQRGLRRRATGSLRLVLMWNGARGQGRTIASALREGWRAQGIVVPYATASWGYLRGLMRRGEFDIALARLSETSDADLYPYFHRRGDQNVTGVVDTVLDDALEAYRAARTPEQRQAAKRRVADRLAVVRPVSVVHAPAEVMLVSRRVRGLTLVDDLPQLTTTMRLDAAERWVLSQR